MTSAVLASPSGGEQRAEEKKRDGAEAGPLRDALFFGSDGLGKTCCTEMNRFQPAGVFKGFYCLFRKEF